MKFGDLHVGDVFVWAGEHVALSHLYKKTSKSEYTSFMEVLVTRAILENKEYQVIRVLNSGW